MELFSGETDIVFGVAFQWKSIVQGLRICSLLVCSKHGISIVIVLL